MRGMRRMRGNKNHHVSRIHAKILGVIVNRDKHASMGQQVADLAFG